MEFRFKRFGVEHERSSMKVGVDGVLVGAWADVSGARGLDVGTGCGLIALMAAQRNPRAMITAIDIDGPSAAEAAANFAASPWPSRLKAIAASWQQFAGDAANAAKFDFIVSNPPFFDAGIANPLTAREQARHIASLSPASLIEGAVRLLSPGGHLSLIMPAGQIPSLPPEMVLKEICLVADRPYRGAKRLLLKLQRVAGHVPCRFKGRPSGHRRWVLRLRESAGAYSAAYRELTSGFYLAF